MADRLKYIKRAKEVVTAVRLDLATKGFTYEKWGSRQKCKAGDWIVDNDGEVYTVDATSFQRTYRKSTKGRYVKVAPVWAQRAMESGLIRTKEGTTKYKAGDFLVSNDARGGDSYAIAAGKFKAMYKQMK